MNPLTNVRNIQKLNQTELKQGGKKSWHDQYKDSAWIFIGGLPYDLTEGDILCVFSQYGEIVNINLVRDKDTGKSKGYGFICFEDQRSTVLTVDNLNSIKLLGRIIRVDHVENYKVPKEHGDEDEITKRLREEGCAPHLPSSEEEEEEIQIPVKKPKTEKDPNKKLKKKKKEKKKKRVEEENSGDEKPRNKEQTVRIKKEKTDLGYERQAKLQSTDERRERLGSDDHRNSVNKPQDRQKDADEFQFRGRDSERHPDSRQGYGVRDFSRRDDRREERSRERRDNQSRDRTDQRDRVRMAERDSDRRDDRERQRRDDQDRDRSEQSKDRIDYRDRQRRDERDRDSRDRFTRNR